MNDKRKILIIRTDRIGDVVLTLPLAKIIKQYISNASITFLVRDYTESLPRNNKYIDSTLVLPVKNNRINYFKLVSLLKNESFDTAVIVYPRLRISLAVWFSGIRQRIGSGYRLFSFLFTHKIYEHRRSGDKHELEYNLSLLAPLGIKKIEKSSVSFDIQTNSKSEQKIDSLLQELNVPVDKKLIIVHPGSGGSSIDLPISSFIKLTGLLARELEYSILITGSEVEKTTCEKFMIDKNTYNLAGKLNLEELTALINRSNLLIANSTGPIHIAAALNKPVVGFYPKIKECSVERWGPYTHNRLIFSPSIDCKNCTREQCERLNCMSSINIDEVFYKITNLLN